MSRGGGRAAGAGAKQARTAVEEAIIRAAAACFGGMGYRATALETIAARAGVSKVTLYKYVPSKEELLCRVFERILEASRAGLKRIVEQDLPADEKLRRIVRYQVMLLASHQPFLAVLFSEEGGLPPQMARRVAREKREYDASIERVIRQGIAARRIRAIDPKLFVFAIDGMCNWMHKWYRPDGKLSPEEIAGAFVDLLERGYLAPAGRGDDPLVAALERLERRIARLEPGGR